MKKLGRVLVLALTLAVASTPTVFVVGCPASASTVEYRTLGTAVELRDTALKAWASYYVAQTPNNSPPSPELAAMRAEVNAADEKFRRAMLVFRGVVSVSYSDRTTAPPEVASAVAALVDLLRSFGVKV